MDYETKYGGVRDEQLGISLYLLDNEDIVVIYD